MKDSLSFLLPKSADIKLLTARARSAATRRAYWQARFTDGRVVSEWEVDWSLLPQRGLREVALVCPNGKVGVVGWGGDGAGRFVQFKMAYAHGWGLNSMTTEAHLVGIVHGNDGEATFYRWEPEAFRLIGPYEDNVGPGRMQYGGGATNQLCFEHMGAKPD